MNRQANQDQMKALMTGQTFSKEEIQELLNLPQLSYQEGLTPAQREILDSIMDDVFAKLVEDGSMKTIPPKRAAGMSQRVHAAPLVLKHLGTE